MVSQLLIANEKFIIKSRYLNKLKKKQFIFFNVTVANNFDENKIIKRVHFNKIINIL